MHKFAKQSSQYLNKAFFDILLVSGKPSQPQGPLEIHDMTDTSMTIKWSPPLDNGGLEIIDYTIEKKETSKKAWQKVKLFMQISSKIFLFASAQKWH